MNESFYILFLPCIIPAVVFASICDVLTFWHFMCTGRVIFFIRFGAETANGPKKTLDDFHLYANNFTDGTIVFNVYDMLFQIIYGPFLILVVLLSVLVDIFTCNTLRVTARLAPEMQTPIYFVRWGIQQLCCRQVTWYSDQVWKECCKIILKDVIFSVAQTL